MATKKMAWGIYKVVHTPWLQWKIDVPYWLWLERNIPKLYQWVQTKIFGLCFQSFWPKNSFHSKWMQNLGYILVSSFTGLCSMTKSILWHHKHKTFFSPHSALWSMWSSPTAISLDGSPTVDAKRLPMCLGIKTIKAST